MEALQLSSHLELYWVSYFERYINELQFHWSLIQKESDFAILP